MASVPTSGPAAPPPPPTWDARPAGVGQVAYGGFWIRVVAYLIDGILLSIICGVVAPIFPESVPYAGHPTRRHYDPTRSTWRLVRDRLALFRLLRKLRARRHRRQDGDGICGS